VRCDSEKPNARHHGEGANQRNSTAMIGMSVDRQLLQKNQDDHQNEKGTPR
jgi:hypothetical protein